MILIDTSGALAAMDASQKHHAACAAAVLQSKGPLLLSPFVLAELDYLLATRVNLRADLAMLSEVARGAYQLETFDADAVTEASAVIEHYRDLDIGLADASIVVLAGRHGARDVLTLDRRHFGVLRRPNGRPFRLLP